MKKKTKIIWPLIASILLIACLADIKYRGAFFQQLPYSMQLFLVGKIPR